MTVTPIQLYDTTLRDGMQGEGMSLSAGEKVRVAHRLDELVRQTPERAYEPEFYQSIVQEMGWRLG